MSDSNKKILITGGAKSGKSRYALELAEKIGEKKAFIATAEALDEEMEARIAAHKSERGDDWDTIDEPLEIVKAIERISPDYDVILTDCVTLWMTNVYLKYGYEEAQVAALGLSTFLSDFDKTNLIIVTNEVGYGIVPMNQMAREYRDLTGCANQGIASVCDDVFMVVCGLPKAFKKDGEIC